MSVTTRTENTCKVCMSQRRDLKATVNSVTVGIAVGYLSQINQKDKGLQLIKTHRDLLRHNSNIVTKKQPSDVKRVWTYAKALTRWAKAGYPVRTNEQAQAIFDTYCKSCEHFNGKVCRHLNCGCRISGQYKTPPTLFSNLKKALSDKLVMGTEKCAIGKW